MLKLAGACFLVAGCAGFGWCICRDMEKRVGQLQLMIRAFSMLASEVGYSKVTLPEGLRRTYYDRCIRIPMRLDARSLNLANSVAILTYEALRQLGFPGLSGEGEMKGE